MNLWQKYFAGVRWLELFMALLIFVLTEVQTKIALGVVLDKTVLTEIGASSAKFLWAYLRNPKFLESTGASVESSATPLNLPAKVDPQAQIIKALVAQGMSEGLARSIIAYDLEEAARIAKGVHNGI